MNKFVFYSLLLCSFSLLAMEGPDPDDQGLVPLELSDTLQLDDGSALHIFYDDAEKSIKKLIHVGSTWSQVTVSSTPRLNGYFQEDFFDVHSLGSVRLPHNRYFYAALARTDKKDDTLLWKHSKIGRGGYDAGPANVYKFVITDKITSVRLFLNSRQEKVISEITLENYEYYKVRLYIPYNNPKIVCFAKGIDSLRPTNSTYESLQPDSEYDSNKKNN